MKTFDTVAKLKLAKLKEGQFVETGGYYAKGDAGAARYLIVTPQAFDGYGDHVLANGNVAELLDTEGKANVLQYGADNAATFGFDSTPNIQAAIDTKREVFIPNGSYRVTSLRLHIGSIVRGESRYNTKLLGQSAVDMITNDDWAHHIVLTDLQLDGNNIATRGIFKWRAFYAVIDRLFLQKFTVACFEIGENTYFNSYTNLQLGIAPRGININPVFDDLVEHAVVNDNVFEQIQCQQFSDIGLYMKGAAGNTFKHIDFELVGSASAARCISIDHCSNNNFKSCWLEPGTPPNMTHLVFITDYLAPFYTRNNEFDNCYFVAPSSGVNLYAVLTGANIRTTVRNSTFIRAKTCVQNGSTSSDLKLENNTYNLFDGSSRVLQGSNAAKQVVRSSIKTDNQFSVGTDTLRVNFAPITTDFVYDEVTITVTVTGFGSITDNLNLNLYTFKNAGSIDIFHGGAVLSGASTVNYDYEIKYLVST